MQRRIMLFMSSAVVNPSDELERALQRRGEPITSREFLEILREISGLSAEPLTLGERDFLLEHTELTESDLTEHSRTGTRLDIARQRLSVERAAIDDALTTAEVAELLGRQESNVRRSRLSGDLYALNDGDAQGLRFPRWQFTEDGRVLPGLRRILPTFPRYTHPAVVERFMTEPHDELEGASPARWLADSAPVDAVVELVAELGYE